MSDATERTAAIAAVTLHASTATQPALTTTEVETIVDSCKRASTWIAGTVYAYGAVVRPTVPNGHYYTAIQAGTASATEPVWPKTRNGQVEDGSSDPVLIWEESGQEMSSIFNTQLAIHKAWQVKAARCAHLVKIDGQNYQHLFEHCNKMAQQTQPLEFN